MTNLKFNTLPLSDAMHRAIADMGFIDATPIQSKAIPLILEGADVTGQAQTGTGKTAAFGIPMLEAINAQERFVSSVILCPTRELAIQVAKEIQKLAKHMAGIRILPIYGGDSIQNQIKDLNRGVHIVVGTPGRVMDHLRRRTLSFANVNMVVLDEADEMLNMGFREDIEEILEQMPKERQTILFSATMPKAILEIAHKFQKSPKLVKVTTEIMTASSVEQQYFESGGTSKISLVSSILSMHQLKLVIVFCNTRRMVDELVQSLQDQGHKAGGLHGDLSQAKRNTILNGFRSGDLSILVATDVAARGIDVTNVDGVFNYDIPLDPEYYVHRIGRTGRAGKTGKAFSFVGGRDDKRRLMQIENFIKTPIERKNVPTEKEMMQLKWNSLYEKLNHIIAEGNLDKYEGLAQNFYDQGMSAEVLSVALLRLTLPPEKRIVFEKRDFSSRKERGTGGYGRNSRDAKGRSESRDGRDRRDNRDSKGYSKEGRDSKTFQKDTRETKVFSKGGSDSRGKRERSSKKYSKTW